MKRIFAMIGVIILIVLYVITIITSIFDSSINMGFFWASVAATILIPLFLWVAIKTYEYVHRNDPK